MRTRTTTLLAALSAAVVAGCAATPDAAPRAASGVVRSTPSPAASPDGVDEPAPAPTPSPATGSGELVYEPVEPVGAADLPRGIDPVRIEIPAIGVDATTVELGMVSASEMETPEDFDDAGWWTLGRQPGAIGPSVIAGHVDSKVGPAVFYRLPELSAGDEIVVHGSDGQTRTFVVDGRATYPKSGLPDEVFGFGEPRPELRLITCAGDFDSSVGHYTDNLVVYAHQAGWDA